MPRIVLALCAVAGPALALNVPAVGAQDAGSAVTVSVFALGCADGSGQGCEDPPGGVAGQGSGVGAMPAGYGSHAVASVDSEHRRPRTSLIGSWVNGWPRS